MWFLDQNIQQRCVNTLTFNACQYFKSSPMHCKIKSIFQNIQHWSETLRSLQVNKPRWAATLDLNISFSFLYGRQSKNHFHCLILTHDINLGVDLWDFSYPCLSIVITHKATPTCMCFKNIREIIILKNNLLLPHFLMRHLRRASYKNFFIFAAAVAADKNPKIIHHIHILLLLLYINFVML